MLHRPFGAMLCLALIVAMVPMPVVLPQRAGEPAVTVRDIHHGTAVWNFTGLAGYGAVNLTASGGGAVIATDALNFTVGPEWLASGAVNYQQTPSVAVDSRNNAVMAWADTRGGGGDYDIYARAFNTTSGSPAGAEINVVSAGNWQQHPSVAVDSRDNMVVAWADKRMGNSDIYAGVFNTTTGALLGSEIIVYFGSFNQEWPAVALDSNDRLFVVWQDYRNGADFNIYGRVFNTATGTQVGGELAISTAAGAQQHPAVAMDSNDRLAVVWEDYRSGTDFDIYGRVYNAGSGTMGSEIPVYSGYGGQMYPSAAAGSDGGFIAAWQDGRNLYNQIYARKFDVATGAPLGSEIAVSVTANDQMYPTVTMNEGNGYFVAWADTRNGMGNMDLYAKAFSAAGVQQGGEIPVSLAGGNQMWPGVAALPSDRFIAAWQDVRNGFGTDDIYLRTGFHPYLPRGRLITPDFTPTDLHRWDDIMANFTLRNGAANGVALSYSTDSGATWVQAAANGSLTGAPVVSGRIRFGAELTTSDNRTTPAVFSMALDYTVNRRPTIDLFPPDGSAPKNRPFTLTAGVGDGDGDTLASLWTLVNGTGASLSNGSMPNATFLATKSGNYTLRLAVGDGYAEAARTLNLSVVNHQPLITGPGSLLSYRKSATPLPFGASDEDGDTLTYGWELAGINPGVTLSDTTVPQPLLTAASAGTVTLRLAVGDGEAEARMVVSVTVVGRPPAANLTANRTTAFEGESIRFDASASADPEGDALQFMFEFGDGNATGWGPSATAAHPYGSAGGFPATVQARDADGNISVSEPLYITVLREAVPDRPPLPSFTFVASPTDPLNITFTSTSTDPDGTIEKTEWNLGDGTNGSGVVVSHRYATAGNYTVTLTVTDSGGGANSTAQTVGVLPPPAANRPPVIERSEPAGDMKVRAGKEVLFTVNASDPDRDALTVRWFLDGKEVATGPEYRFVPGKAGRYSVRVNASDGKLGAERVWRMTVTGAPAVVTAPSLLQYIAILAVLALSGVGAYAAWRRSRRAAAGPQAHALSPVPPPAGFAIEEVFLIYRDGRLIQHTTRSIRADMDVDIMTSMLRAMQEFVKDSLGTGDELGSMEYGENRILFRRGRHVVLAAVISGGEPANFRDEMGAAVNNIEGEYGAVLPVWDGEPAKLSGAKRFLSQLGAYRPGEPEPGTERLRAEVSLSGELEFYQGFIRLKVAVKNAMPTLLANAALDLMYDRDALRLDRIEPEYPVEGSKVLFGNMDPKQKKSVAYYLDPQICSESYIEGVLSCKDAHGNLLTLQMPRKLAAVVCPIMYTDENINTAMLRRMVAEQLDKKDCKLFAVPAGLSPQEAFDIGKAAVQHHDARLVREFSEKEPYTAEAWYFGKAKGRDDRLVVRVRVIAEKSCLEFFGASGSTLMLTGLLAELKSDLRREIEARKGKGRMAQVTEPAKIDAVKAVKTLLDREPDAGGPVTPPGGS